MQFLPTFENIQKKNKNENASNLAFKTKSSVISVGKGTNISTGNENIDLCLEEPLKR